ncbi:EAL domain-containing protein [Actinoplanes missouriensis]|uniref:EAL domain-containing protein n=1 Tax=Actinoplanes missouriensis TaxID=1866 RepID=UPI0033F5A781
MQAIHARATAAVAEVLRDRLVMPLFQPIVDLSSGLVVGLEALARGPAGAELEFPDRLFAAAREAGLLAELDMLCVERALECTVAASVPPPLLFINAEPAVLDQPVSARVIEMVGNGLPFRYILEYTERALPTSPGVLVHLAGIVHQFGNGIALDDVGVDPMSLAFLPVLEPEVIKLDMSLLRNPDTEHTRAVCTAVAAEARRTGAVVLAEGVETEKDLVTARRLGARWGQGWLFGRPAPMGQVTHRFDPAAAAQVPPPRPGFHQAHGTPFQVAARHGPVVTGSATQMTAALARLRNLIAAHSHAVIVMSAAETDAPALEGLLADATNRTRSVIMLDDPVPGESAVAVIGPAYGSAALCVESASGRLVFLDRLPAVAEVARVLLNRLGPGRLADGVDHPDDRRPQPPPHLAS